jgi:amidase
MLLSCEVPRSPDVGTIHVLREAFDVADPQVKQAMSKPLDLLNALFPGKLRDTSIVEIVGVSVGKPLHAWYETYCRLQWAEIWSCFGSWIEQTKPELGPRIRINFELTRNMDRAEIGYAARRRETYCAHLKTFLGSNDLICIPTTPAPAPLKGSLGIDRTTCDYYPRALGLTSIAGIGRLPQVSLPLAHVDGAPIGMSLLASRGMDGFLLSVVRMVAAGFMD